MSSIVSQVPRKFTLEVARGNISGYQSVGIVGVNPSTGDDFEDVWDAGGFFVFPTAGETWEILSDDVNDTSAGTGARQAIITGLDNNYLEQTETVILNGTTPVVTVRTDWFRVRSVTVILSGSSQSNVGTLTLRVSSGGAVRSKIRPEMGRTFNGFFTVPAGKTLFVLKTSAFIPKNEDVTIRNRFLVNNTNTFLTGGDIDIYQNSVVTGFEAIPTLPEKTDSQILVKSTNTAVKVTVTIEAILANGTGSPMVTF